MRRLLLGVVVFLIIGMVLSLVFREHQGYVLISFNGWQIETSLLFAVAGVLLGVWLLALAWRILVAVLFAPRTIRRFRLRRRQKKARHSWQSGLAHLAEGRWEMAEYELEALAEANESPGLNHLFAARAAHYRGDMAARDRYLKKAASGKSISELAVLMTRAELQIAAGQNADASQTLARLHEIEPRHPWVIRLAAEHAFDIGDYDTLYNMSSELKRVNSLPDERRQQMMLAAHQHRLKHIDDAAVLTSAWRDVPRDLRRHRDMIHCYAERLARLGQDDEAANVARGYLKKHYDPELVRIYSRLNPSDRSAQLSNVRSWLDEHGRQPELMLAAGRLYLEREELDEARKYLSSEDAAQVSPDGLMALGRLLERLNEAERSLLVYRRGLETVVHNT